MKKSKHSLAVWDSSAAFAYPHPQVCATVLLPQEVAIVGGSSDGDGVAAARRADGVDQLKLFVCEEFTWKWRLGTVLVAIPKVPLARLHPLAFVGRTWYQHVSFCFCFILATLASMWSPFVRISQPSSPSRCAHNILAMRRHVWSRNNASIITVHPYFPSKFILKESAFVSHPTFMIISYEYFIQKIFSLFWMHYQTVVCHDIHNITSLK